MTATLAKSLNKAKANLTYILFHFLSGTAYTLLYSEQVHHFKELIQKTGREKIPKYAIKDAELQPLVERYERALEQLEERVKSDKQTDNRRVKLKGQEEGALKKQK